MPLPTKEQRKQKIKDIELQNLIKKICKFSIIKDDIEIKNIIKIDPAEKKISISNPNYDRLSFVQKKDLFLLKNQYGFFIQWEFFII